MDLSFWTNIAVVFLAVETTILLTVLVVAFYFVVRGLNFAHVRLPGILLRAQEIVHSVRTRTDDAGERIVAPLVATALGASVKPLQVSLIKRSSLRSGFSV